MHPESSCAASARCSSRATHAWAWPVCWRSPSARRRCSPAPSLGGALGPLLARLLHCADSDIEAGLYGYNAVLIGMLLAFRFAWSPGLVSLVALGCLASVALQRLFLHGLRRRRWLPPYTLGFVLNGWWLVPLGAWLGLAPAAHGGCFSCAWSGTAELAALALGIGEIIFLGEPLAGLLVWLGLLLVSRPSAAWALAGAAATCRWPGCWATTGRARSPGSTA